MNAETVAQGLTITVVGMGLVFLVLGLLVVAMLLMGRVLRPKAVPSPSPGPAEIPARSDRARVAILAAAVAMSLSQQPQRAAGGWHAVVEGQALGPWQRPDLARHQGPLREGDMPDEAIPNRP